MLETHKDDMNGEKINANHDQPRYEPLLELDSFGKDNIHDSTNKRRFISILAVDRALSVARRFYQNLSKM